MDFENHKQLKRATENGQYILQRKGNAFTDLRIIDEKHLQIRKLP